MWTRRFGVWVRGREHGMARSVVEPTPPLVLNVTPLAMDFGRPAPPPKGQERSDRAGETQMAPEAWTPAEVELVTH